VGCHTQREPRLKRDSARKEPCAQISSAVRNVECGSPPIAVMDDHTRSRRTLLHQHHNRARCNGIVDTKHLLFLPRLTDVVRRVLSGVDDAVPRLV